MNVQIDHAELARQRRAHIERGERLGWPVARAAVAPQPGEGAPEPADAHVSLRHAVMEALADAHVRAWQAAMERPVDLDVMDLDPPPPPIYPDDAAPWVGVSKVKVIVAGVADHYKITPRDLLSRRNTANVVWPRQVAMYLARRLTKRSLPDIGRRLDGRDHTTVGHAVRKVEAMVGKDPALAAEMEVIIRKIMRARA